MSLDIASLPFDVDEMLAGLRPWVECESPTFDSAAVNRMMDLAAKDLVALGAQVERLPGRLGTGDCLRARLPHPRRDSVRSGSSDDVVPGILVAGHFDTVHPVGTLEALPFRRDGELCHGPGICDMKGGNYLALEALRQLARAGVDTPLPVTVLFTSDEEIGTPANRELIESEAKGCRAVLVPEPGIAGGGMTSGRYAIARYELSTIGRPSHAGARLGEGRSAIREMARRILEIEDMSGDDCTFSVGVLHAGQWVNCVSSRCDAEVLSMAKRQGDLDAGIERMLALADTDTDAEVRFEVVRGVTRPVWEPSAGTLELVELATAFAREVGIEAYHKSQGGGSDGNFTGALGIPTLDGLGVEGDGIHTLNEHIRVDTLASRGRIFAGLLASIE